MHEPRLSMLSTQSFLPIDKFLKDSRYEGDRGFRMMINVHGMTE